MDTLIEQTLGVLDTEKVNPSSTEIDRMSPLEIVQTMNAEDERVAQAVKQVLPQIALSIKDIVGRLRRKGRLIYIGAGTSGRLGALDASECPPTFNIPSDMVISCIAGGQQALDRAYEDLEDCWEAGQKDLVSLDISEVDVVIGISASGRTPYVLGAMAYARDRGALTIGLACNAKAPLEKEVEIMITPVVGSEVISGSTRLKAGTAQKMVINMLSTGTMVLLGKTFGNLMVDVQVTNYKLRQRAIKIVQNATGLAKDEAEQLLQQAGDETKTAILMGLTHTTPEEARKQLAEHNGILRATLEAMQ